MHPGNVIPGAQVGNCMYFTSVMAVQWPRTVVWLSGWVRIIVLQCFVTATRKQLKKINSII